MQTQFVSINPLTTSKSGTMRNPKMANPITWNVSNINTNPNCTIVGFVTFRKKQIRAARNIVPSSGNEKANTRAHIQAIRCSCGIIAYSSRYGSNKKCLAINFFYGANIVVISILHLILQYLTRLSFCVCVAINKNVDLARTPAQSITTNTKVNVNNFNICLNDSNRLVSTAEPPVWVGGGSWKESHNLSFCCVR